MNPSDTREPALRAAGLAPLEPGELATAERFRSLLLLSDSPDTGRAARRMAREVVQDWALPLAADDVELAVSELVGNAVHHAVPDGRLLALGGERRVAIAFRAWSRWMFVEVADEDSSPPMLPAGELLQPALSAMSTEALLSGDGRGLFLVQSVADAVWWSPRESGGKSVFARFDLHDRNGGAAT